MALWVADIENMVFSLIKAKTYSKLKIKYPNIRYTTVATSRENAKFPSIYFRQLDSPETGQTMEGADINGVSVAFQVDVTSNVSKSNVKEIIYVLAEELKKMKFDINVFPIFSVEDDVHRGTMRVRRIIANKDIL